MKTYCEIDTAEKLRDYLTVDHEEKPDLLLHACCACCASEVITRLQKAFNVIVYYYNDNTYPEAEYEKRYAEFKKLPPTFKIIKADYNEKYYLDYVKGYEKEKEGGARCKKCYEMRIGKTAEEARKQGIPYFTTTLSISPHKNSALINALGQKWAQITGVNFVYSDFKKKDGFLKSVKIAKELNLYRQNYCGCRFSLHENL